MQGVLDVAVGRIRKELLPRYPHVDDVVAVNHAYGCGVAINAPEAKVPIRALRNLCHHPNFGGQLMAVSPGLRKAHGRHAGRAGKQYAGKRGNLAGQQGL